MAENYVPNGTAADAAYYEAQQKAEQEAQNNSPSMHSHAADEMAHAMDGYAEWQQANSPTKTAPQSAPVHSHAADEAAHAMDGYADWQAQQTSEQSTPMHSHAADEAAHAMDGYAEWQKEQAEAPSKTEEQKTELSESDMNAADSFITFIRGVVDKYFENNPEMKESINKWLDTFSEYFGTSKSSEKNVEATVEDKESASEGYTTDVSTPGPEKPDEPIWSEPSQPAGQAVHSYAAEQAAHAMDGYESWQAQQAISPVKTAEQSTPVHSHAADEAAHAMDGYAEWQAQQASEQSTPIHSHAADEAAHAMDGYSDWQKTQATAPSKTAGQSTPAHSHAADEAAHSMDGYAEWQAQHASAPAKTAEQSIPMHSHAADEAVHAMDGYDSWKQDKQNQQNQQMAEDANKRKLDEMSRTQVANTPNKTASKDTYVPNGTAADAAHYEGQKKTWVNQRPDAQVRSYAAEQASHVMDGYSDWQKANTQAPAKQEPKGYVSSGTAADGAHYGGERYQSWLDEQRKAKEAQQAKKMESTKSASSKDVEGAAAKDVKDTAQSEAPAKQEPKTMDKHRSASTSTVKTKSIPMPGIDDLASDEKVSAWADSNWKQIHDPAVRHEQAINMRATIFSDDIAMKNYLDSQLGNPDAVAAYKTAHRMPPDFSDKQIQVAMEGEFRGMRKQYQTEIANQLGAPEAPPEPTPAEHTTGPSGTFRPPVPDQPQEEAPPVPIPDAEPMQESPLAPSDVANSVSAAVSKGVELFAGSDTKMQMLKESGIVQTVLNVTGKISEAEKQHQAGE